MENNKSKGILVSYTDLDNIIDRYEFLMFTLNSQITPTINRMIRLQKEVQNLNTLIIKVQSIEKNLIQVNQTIENSTNQILNEKIDKAITLEINKKSKISTHTLRGKCDGITFSANLISNLILLYIRT